MAMLYNPESMPEKEIRETFVARHGLVDDLIDLIRQQPIGAGVQHAIVVGPRGMGKTTILLMLRFALAEKGLSDQWLAVKFPEESYGIFDLADLWIKAAILLANETSDAELNNRIVQIQLEHQDKHELQEAVYSLLSDWSNTHSKRILLLVDNFDMILQQINDERDNAALRDTLMNKGTVMIVGSAVSFFKEVKAYEQPLYNFFKIYDLYKLKYKHVRELLKKRAFLDNKQDFEQFLHDNEDRIRALEYFTGGNPRLVLMLYRVITESNLNEMRRSLEKLLDEVTPYYKAKTEILPAQQRKILDHIAITTSKTREGVTPTEIATATRLKSNQVSMQLKRLTELGYIHSANIRSRSAFYMLSEPLYGIWYQMRFSRETRVRMGWLVNFLRALYKSEEISSELSRLENKFMSCMRSGRLEKAHDFLEHSRYLMDAMEDEKAKPAIACSILKNYMQISDIEHVKELVDKADLNNLTDEEFNDMVQKLESKLQITHSEVLTRKAERCFFNNKIEESIGYLKEFLKESPNSFITQFILGVELGMIWKFEEAIQSFDKVIAIKPDWFESWFARGNALYNLGRYDEAILSYDKVIAIKQDNEEAWFNRGNACIKSSRYDEAILSYDKVIAINPNKLESWLCRGLGLATLGKYSEAILSYDKAIDIDPNNFAAWVCRGATLTNFGNNNEAIQSLKKSLEIKSDVPVVWYCLIFNLFSKAAYYIQNNEIQFAKTLILEASGYKKNINEEQWIELLLNSFLPILSSDKTDSLKEALSGIDELKEVLFPLLRALDYLQTGNEDLIEKLTPEYRGIVKNIIGKIKNNQKKENLEN